MVSNIARVCALCFIISIILPLIVLEPDFIDASVMDDQEDPPLWHLAPGSLEEFPTMQGHTVIDPWDYLQRLGMYKLMLNRSTAAMESLGPNNTGNILWGLPLQHGWQFTTKRLLDYDTKSHWNCPGVSKGQKSTCISVSSWWASMNYNLNVVPFLASVKAGMFGYWKKEIYMLPPRIGGYGEPFKQEKLQEVKLTNKYCCTVAECFQLFPKATAAWTEFFTLVLKLNVSRASLSSSDIEEELLTSMWAAHVESIAESLPVFKDRLQYLSVPEQTFGQGWAHLVGFIAATHFSTNYNNTRKNQMTLPNRILLNTDHPPDIADMSPATNRALTILSQLYEWDKYMGGSLERMWVRAMCTERGRRLGRKLMEDISSSWSLSVMDVIKLIWLLAWEPCSPVP